MVYNIPGHLATETYSYTPSGRIATKEFKIAAGASTPTITGSLAYNEDGQVQSVTYPNGAVYNYQFDTMGRPRKLAHRLCWKWSA